MSYRPTYDNENSVNCSVVLSYVDPFGEICSVVYNNVSAQKLSLIKKIINSK